MEEGEEDTHFLASVLKKEMAAEEEEVHFLVKEDSCLEKEEEADLLDW